MTSSEEWQRENKEHTRNLVVLFNNMYEANGSIPSWDDFKELWEMIQE